MWENLWDRATNTLSTVLDYDLARRGIASRQPEAPSSPAYTAANKFETSGGVYLGFTQQQIVLAGLAIAGLFVLRKVL